MMLLLFAAKAEPSAAALAKADSLFHLKQYTQSLEIFQALFSQKKYSPSMLLKMAYIEEGLGHIAQSTYYLNLYYLATDDPLALNKLTDTAARNRLEGYEASDAQLLVTQLKQHYFKILFLLASACLFLLAWTAFEKLKRKRRPIWPPSLLAVFLAALFAHTWLNAHSEQGIVASPVTYLMEGPSAGAPVAAIVGEGHRLNVLGKKDVWVKVKWMDRDVFVRQADLVEIRL